MPTPHLIIGIGSGRCGTKSLAKLLDQQSNAAVTHEFKPVLPWKDAKPRARIAERIAALQHLGRRTELAGDVAHYYLNYLEHAIELERSICIVCLKRPREEVTISYERWVRAKFGSQVNHWAPAGGKWKNSPIWSSCFPKYDTDDMRTAIGRYWDDYYGIVDKLQEKYANNLRVFDMRDALNTEAGQRRLLDFVKIPRSQQRISTRVVLNANA